MRLHDRYLFREFLTPLAFCLCGFLVFWVSFAFFTDLEPMQEAKLHAWDCIEYVASLTPGFFVLVLPILLLLSLLYALTHHSRYNEITALRAAGVSLWRLCAPYFVVGLVATGIYFALNELLVPRCDEWSQRILTRYVQKDHRTDSKNHFSNAGFGNPRTHRTWRVGEYDYFSKTMLNLEVAWTLPDGSWKEIKADRAVYTNNAWTFFNAQMFAQAGAHLVPVFITNEVVMTEFDENPKQIRQGLRFSASTGVLATHSMDIPLADLWPYLRHNSNVPVNEKTRQSMITKFNGRLAAPWTCLVVVLIAIPFGAQPGRRNLFFGVAGSIFLCFGYFILQQVGLALGMNGYLPGWLGAWLPNIFFAAIGIIMTLRIK